MYSFDNKGVVVPGGNSGIGKVIAKRFVDAGAKVLICSRNEKVLSATAKEIGAQYHVCDISDWEATKNMAEAAREKLGTVDIGVNSAGIEEMILLRKLSPGHVAKMVAIQFSGALHFMQHITNVMVDGGSLINLSSVTGSVACPGYIAYGGAKAGVNHATKVAAVELAGRQIRVNAVSPTVVRTPLVEEMFKVPGFEGALLEETPLGALPKPEDVADAVLWLASEHSKFVTGEIVHVDGGGRQTRMPRPGDVQRHAAAAKAKA